MQNVELSSSARLAYWWLYTTARDGVSPTSNAALGKRIGIKVDAVALLSRELARAGLIERFRTKGAGTGQYWRLLGVRQRANEDASAA